MWMWPLVAVRDSTLMQHGKVLCTVYHALFSRWDTYLGNAGPVDLGVEGDAPAWMFERARLEEWFRHRDHPIWGGWDALIEVRNKLTGAVRLPDGTYIIFKSEGRK